MKDCGNENVIAHHALFCSWFCVIVVMKRRNNLAGIAFACQVGSRGFDCRSEKFVEIISFSPFNIGDCVSAVARMTT